MSDHDVQNDGRAALRVAVRQFGQTRTDEEFPPHGVQRVRNAGQNGRLLQGVDRHEDGHKQVRAQHN